MHPNSYIRCSPTKIRTWNIGLENRGYIPLTMGLFFKIKGLRVFQGYCMNDGLTFTTDVVNLISFTHPFIKIREVSGLSRLLHE